MQFIFAMTLISATPMAGISKFAFIATTMTMLGVSSSLILKGSKTTVEMFKDLYASVELMNAITRTNTKGLRNVTDDILQSANDFPNFAYLVEEEQALVLLVFRLDQLRDESQHLADVFQYDGR